MSNIKLFYDVSSFYSGLAVIRICRKIRDKSFVNKFELKPFVLGGVFKSQGVQAPALVNPTKGKYMWRDVERLAKELGYPHFANSAFPLNSVLAGRVIAYLNANEAKFKNSEPEIPIALRFSEKTFEAAYVQDVDVTNAENLSKILKTILPDVDTDAIVKEANTQKYKDILKANTNEAIELGIFGAPSFICPDGELFWGNDRLMSAYNWTKKAKL
ncbi:thioredoxin-like protein [Conidiobolus coronatus NRRL 28638]|uniref:Glutathione S-transferase kappa n=1 Tax=Conidiobolus coronatus (strain ATCC 28846 / CBS 209.66 / NRRL 28638) TaxID=796925 RepID=A0A137PIX9_CONC2|nr:thioredoxin-like protein [Conidiobolus coronatus NRRL 28638]|eukprot:KXN74954.1 thioredoxin-like protein [Conidiobolus coronatus NRRL 28638]